MSKTVYFTDDQNVLVEFGELMPLPREGAEALWLRAGGQTDRASFLPPTGYNPPPDHVTRPEKPPPPLPAKTAQKPPTQNAVRSPFADHIPGLRAQPGQAGTCHIELKCHRCGAIIDAVLTQICPVL